MGRPEPGAPLRHGRQGVKVPLIPAKKDMAE
jgi:hypothetical protein